MTPPNRNDFRFYDVSDFPIVRIRGSALPAGYAAQWIKEMEALLTNAEPFAFVFLDNAEHPEHEDQKAQMQWLKANKKALARICGLNALAAVHALVGIDSVVRIVKVVGFVASAPGFNGQPAVINGASELIGEVFGAAGAHARSAFGVAQIPMGACVEIELIAEVG